MVICDPYPYSLFVFGSDFFFSIFFCIILVFYCIDPPSGSQLFQKINLSDFSSFFILFDAKIFELREKTGVSAQSLHSYTLRRLFQDN